jgi:hypothetical protein
MKPSNLNDDAAVAATGGHTRLEELLASCVVRQVMEKDGVDPQDVRKLIDSVASARAQFQ